MTFASLKIQTIAESNEANLKYEKATRRGRDSNLQQLMLRNPPQWNFKTMTNLGNKTMTNLGAKINTH